MDIDIALTFSILPHCCWSEESALALHEHGHEIMLHQPMEPFSTEVDPGPGAIFVEDRPERIHQVVGQNIATLPHVAGVNNHMGSKYTQQAQKMDQALDVVRNQGLFFVDSLTTGRSTAYACARQMGVSTKRRDLFLDNRQDMSSVIRQLQRLRTLALRNGSAIGIGIAGQADGCGWIDRCALYLQVGAGTAFQRKNQSYWTFLGLAAPYSKVPGDPAYFFDPETMEPLINSPMPSGRSVARMI